MRKGRNPEYDRRDLMFVHQCEICSRANRCSFKDSVEGPENVCKQLIEGGISSCEYCLRRKLGGHVCKFECCFFKPIKPVVD